MTSNTKTQTQFLKMIKEIVGDSLTTKDSNALMKQFKEKKEVWSAFLTSLESSSTGRRTKRNVDPSAPKRPKNAYLFFCNANHSRISSENPQATPADVMTLLGQLWKSLSEADKAPFAKMALDDKARYVPRTILINLRRPRSPLPVLPLRSLVSPNGYNLFCREHKDLKTGDESLASAQSKAWKSLTDEERDAYRQRAKSLPQAETVTAPVATPAKPQVVASAPASESVASSTSTPSKRGGKKVAQATTPVPAPVAPVVEEPVPAPVSAPAKKGRAVAKRA